jgi:hypothetical protein
MASGGIDPVAQALATATSTQVGALGQETATVLLEEGWGMSSPDGRFHSDGRHRCRSSTCSPSMNVAGVTALSNVRWSRKAGPTGKSDTHGRPGRGRRIRRVGEVSVVGCVGSLIVATRGDEGAGEVLLNVRGQRRPTLHGPTSRWRRAPRCW